MAKWVEDGVWLGDVRLHGWYQNTGGAGEPMPPNTVAEVSYDTKSRKMKLYAWSAEGGDYTKEYSLDTIPFGDRSFPTGRFDPMGPPSITYHGGQLKIWVAGWGGDGNPNGGVLIRIYTNLRFK